MEDNPNPEGIAVTQDEIIEMAKESDLGFLLGDSWLMHHEIEYFAKLVAKKEREACAKLFELTDLGGLKSDVWLQNYTATILDGYAKAIKARGQA